MSVEFSAKISMLRKERNISQRQASDDLGVSQALLSHYEKGIRECNLDFVKKAAAYYEVSSDYLLGISDTKNPSVRFLSPETTDEADINGAECVIQSLVYLLKRALSSGDGATEFYYDYFSLCIKKYASLISPGNVIDGALNDLCLRLICDEKREDKKRFQDISDLPEALKNAYDRADGIIDDNLKLLTKG